MYSLLVSLIPMRSIDRFYASLLGVHTDGCRALQSVKKMCLPSRPSPGTLQRFPILHRLWLLHIPDSDQVLQKQTIPYCTVVHSIAEDMKHPSAAKPGSRSANQAHTQNHGSSADGAGLSSYSLLVSLNPMQCIDEVCYSLLESILADEKPSQVQ